MSKYLSGVTHAVVSVSKEQDAKRFGLIAIVTLCFGQGETSIGGMQYTKQAGRLVWRAPMYYVLKNGQQTPVPIFKGDLLLEVSKLSSQAVSRVKKEFGSPAWGHTYTVYKDKVVHTDDQGKEVING